MSRTSIEVSVDDQGRIHLVLPPRGGADAWFFQPDEAEKLVAALAIGIQNARRIQAERPTKGRAGFHEDSEPAP